MALPIYDAGRSVASSVLPESAGVCFCNRFTVIEIDPVGDTQVAVLSHS